jgi:hypothetical protein
VTVSVRVIGTQGLAGPTGPTGPASTPTTTLGDLIVRGASADERLAIGATGNVLRVVDGRPAWGAEMVNVRDHGAVADVRTVTDAAMTAASATLTSATAAFTAADAGKSIVVTGAGVDLQSWLVSGSPTGGSYVLSHNGNATGSIAYNASAATVQAALRLLPGLSSVTVVNNGDPPDAQYFVTFAGYTGARATLSVQTNALTGGTSPAVTVTHVQNALATTIAAYVSATQVTLATTAKLTVAGARATYYTDNAAAFAAAIAATPDYGATYLPPGDYGLATTVTGKSNWRLTGQARIFSGAFDGVALSFPEDTTDAEVSVLTFQGPPHSLHPLPGNNGGSGNSCAIFLNPDCARIVVRDCHFKDFWHGGVEIDGSYNRVEGCDFVNVNHWLPAPSNTNRGAIHARGGWHTIAHNVITDVYDHGVTIEGTEGCLVQGNTKRHLTGWPAMGAGMGVSCYPYPSRPARWNRIIGNYAEGCSAEGIVVAASPHAEAYGNIVADNQIVNCNQGIALSTNTNTCHHNIVSGNQIYLGTMTGPGALRASRAGIVLHAAHSNIIADNQIRSDGTWGYFGINSVVGLTNPVTEASGNTIVGNLIEGLATTEATSQRGTAIVLRDASGGTAAVARWRVANNTIRDVRNGIVVLGGTSRHAIIGNTIEGSTVDSINVAATATDILIANNDLDRAPTISNGAETTAHGNLGWVTEANGTATVANGATTAVVTHGLGRTPALKDIAVTPTNNMGNATKFWVSSPTSTQFTINVGSDPGATTATFAWQAKVP